jgi:hypothetical protein
MASRFPYDEEGHLTFARLVDPIAIDMDRVGL